MIHVPMSRDVDPSDARSQILSGVEISRIVAAEPSIEDAFIWLVHSQGQPA